MIQIAGGIVLAVVFLALLPTLIRLGLWLLMVVVVLGGVGLITAATEGPQAGAGLAAMVGMVWMGVSIARSDARAKRERAAEKAAQALAKHEAALLLKYPR